MHQSGIENVVASSGTALTPGQIRMIHRFTENVTVIYDGDAAGIKASLRGIDLLLEEGLNIKVLLLPDGEDPDSFARKHNSADFIEFVTRNSVDFMRFKTNLLMEDAGRDPVKRANLILDIVKSIAIIPNPVIRSEYVKECSTMLQVDEAMLYHEIGKLKKKGETEAQSPTAIATKTATQVDTTPLPTVEQSNLYANEERNILQMLIRYGKLKLKDENFRNENGEQMTVAEFVFNELNNDNLSFYSEIHQILLKDYEAHYQTDDFDGERFFLYHSNPEIVRLTADLITEKYTLSKVHSKMKKIETVIDRLDDFTARVVYEFKNKILLEMIKDRLLQLKQASEAKDFARVDEIMNELSAMEVVKKQLAKKLGERIIIRL